MNVRTLFTAVIAAAASVFVVVLVSKSLNLDSTIGGAIGGGIGAVAAMAAITRQRAKDQAETESKE